MDDLISRQAAIDALDEYIEEYSEIDPDGNHGEKWCAMQEAKMVIENMPSAQPERKTGRWIEVDDHYNRISGRCSMCGWEALLYETDVVGMDYCPNCGADMRGESDG